MIDKFEEHWKQFEKDVSPVQLTGTDKALARLGYSWATTDAAAEHVAMLESLDLDLRLQS